MAKGREGRGETGEGERGEGDRGRGGGEGEGGGEEMREGGKMSGEVSYLAQLWSGCRRGDQRLDNELS